MSYAERLKGVQTILSKNKIDALLIDHPKDLLYLTGIELSAGKLLATRNGAHLLVDGRYIEKCKRESPIPVILAQDNSLQELLASPNLEKIGFDSEQTSFKAYKDLDKIIFQINKIDNKNLNLVPIDNPIKQLRSIKDATELRLMNEAAILGSEGFDYVCLLLKEGITEAEVALKLEIFWKERGGKSVAFDPIIAFGPNSSMPHYRAGNVKLTKGQPVLIDIGVTLKNYHSDMTRTLFFGPPDPKLIEIYDIVKEAQQKALDLCKPGISVGALDEAARKLIASKGYGENFSHSLGHGIGLDVHEYPIIRNKSPYKEQVLEPRMVITIEPGIYLPDIGGVRIEDTIVITKGGYINLTKRPKGKIIIN